MKNFNQSLLFLLFVLSYTVPSIAQESTLNPNALLFNTTPVSTQSSSYGLNGVIIQNGFNVGSLNSTQLSVGSDLLYSTLIGNQLAIRTAAQIPAFTTLFGMDKLAFQVQGVGQGYEDWKIGRENNANNNVSNALVVTREAGFTNGGVTFGVAVYIEPDNLNVGIGIVPANNCKLDVGGNICSNGVFVASDLRFKNNIHPLKKSLEKLLALRGVSYDYKTEEFKAKNFPDTKQLGLIAQELETVFPELILTFEDGYKAVNYEGLIPVLIEALKEEHAEKEVQNKEIEALKNEMETMQNEVQELKQMLLQLTQTTSKTEQTTVKLSDAQLFQNAPNPFSKNTTIQYFIPENVQTASLNINNLEGQLIKSIPIDVRGKGELLLEAYSLSAGQYVYYLTLDGKVFESRKMVLTK